MSEQVSNYISELMKNGVIAFVPSGNSMWPTLKNKGQSVIVKKKTEKLRAMDVALYCRKNGANVLHRVIKSTENGYVMCGDSQFVLENVEEDMVYGVMEGFYRGKTYVAATDPAYIEEIRKLYSNEKKRKRRVKRYFFFLGIINLPKRAARKLCRIFGLKRREK